ncbi:MULTISPECIES: hypothetical protein [Agrobacterium]|uniref:hypothetical protein n=1 Tax=Agrobacterium TaxID=357 RepID=UPI000D1E8622|nr:MULTISPECIES: hypothetical protein [Agrobacterium]
MSARDTQKANTPRQSPIPAVIEFRPREPIKVIDLPGFIEAENKFLLYRSAHGELSADLASYLDELSKNTFGITEDDTKYRYPDEYYGYPVLDPRRVEHEGNHNWNESCYETSRMNADDAANYMLERGFDFRQDDGRTMLVTKHFCRQAEHAANGWPRSKIPEAASTKLEKLEQNLARQSREFRAKKLRK